MTTQVFKLTPTLVKEILRMELEHRMMQFQENPNTEHWEGLEQAMYSYQYVFRLRGDEAHALLADVGVGYWSVTLAERARREADKMRDE